MSLKDAILARKPPERTVDTPAGSVLARGMTLAAKDAVQGAAMRGEAWRPYVLLHCALDPETKQPIFEGSDINALHDVSSDFESVVDAVLELSAVTPEEQEELEGN